MNGDIKIGKLLCDEDIITKRQLNKALQVQVKGDKRTIGEILVDLGFCDFDDITNALLGSDEDTKHHEEKTEEIHQEPVKKEEPKQKPKKKKPVELSEDKVMGTKFTMSVQTIVALVAIISSGVGGYYMLLQEIEEAKNLPEPPSIESILEMNIHPNQMVIIGHGLMNNINNKSEDYRKIWTLFMKHWMNMKNKLQTLKKLLVI